MSKVIDLSLFYLHKTFLIYILSYLNWNRKRLRWEKETAYSVLWSMKISVGSIQSTWLWREGGGGVRTMSVRRLHWKRKATFWNIFANGVFRCHLGSGVSQLLLCYQQPSYWGGGVHISIADFFCRNFSQIFFIHLWPLSFNREGWYKKYPLIYRGNGGGCQIQQNFFQESKRRCEGY